MILISAFTQSDFFGKLIFFGLFALSIVSWIVLIQKIQELRTARRLSDAFRKVIDENESKLLGVHPETTHPFAFVFASLKKKTLEILEKNLFFARQEGKEQVHLSEMDLDVVEAHLLNEVANQSKRLEKHVFILSTVVTLAPFLGLLGTVWGILITFSELQAGGALHSNSAVLGGLSTALATTVIGLLIAIPALIARNYLKNGLKVMSSDMENFSYRLLSTIEMQYRKPL